MPRRRCCRALSRRRLLFSERAWARIGYARRARRLRSARKVTCGAYVPMPGILIQPRRQGFHVPLPPLNVRAFGSVRRLGRRRWSCRCGGVPAGVERRERGSSGDVMRGRGVRAHCVGHCRSRADRLPLRLAARQPRPTRSNGPWCRPIRTIHRSTPSARRCARPTRTCRRRCPGYRPKLSITGNGGDNYTDT